MIVKFSKLGQLGRLGNQMFQIASTIGIAEANGGTAIFPEWSYSKYFKESINQNDINGSHITLREKSFAYSDFNIVGGVADIEGYLQSEKYYHSVSIC